MGWRRWKEGGKKFHRRIEAETGKKETHQKGGMRGKYRIAEGRLVTPGKKKSDKFPTNITKTTETHYPAKRRLERSFPAGGRGTRVTKG